MPLIFESMIYWTTSVHSTPWALPGPAARARLSFEINYPSMSDSVEQSLIKRAAGGDTQAFTQLIERYHGPMLRRARAIAGETHAEDVVQEAWASIYRALAGFEGRSSLKTWIMTIVGNEAKTRLRQEARKLYIEDMEGRHPYLQEERFLNNGHWRELPTRWHTESPDALLEEKQLRRCIDKTLSLLPPRQKAAFWLRDIEQRPFDDICEQLDLSAANVRVLVHRARLTLMQVIDRYQETGQC